MTPLDDLIAAVEAGKWEAVFRAVPPIFALNTGSIDARNRHHWVLDAYRGSLDAALRLHEALLPGWAWIVRELRDIPGTKGAGGFLCSLTSPDFYSVTWEAGDQVTTDIVRGEAVSARSANPARAWLLAILRALKTQEEGQ